MQDVNKIRAYQDAVQFATELQPILENLEQQRKFDVRTQLSKSSNSVPANLAEFAAFAQKGAKTEKLQRCIAEANETEYWLHRVLALGILTESQHAVLNEKNRRIRMQLCKLKQRVEQQ